MPHSLEDEMLWEVSTDIKGGGIGLILPFKENLKRKREVRSLFQQLSNFQKSLPRSILWSLPRSCIRIKFLNNWRLFSFEIGFSSGTWTSHGWAQKDILKIKIKTFVKYSLIFKDIHIFNSRWLTWREIKFQRRCTNIITRTDPLDNLCK